jgi:hypothetical protein
MKKFIKQSINLSLVIGIVTMFIGCKKGPDFKTYTYPTPTVTGFAPTSGYPGIYATITGKDFGALKGAVKVFFGGVKADSIISCVDNQIVVKVPAGAITGKVTLQIWTHTNDSIGKFTVIPAPVLTSVTSSNKLQSNVALPGTDTVTIKGTGFGTDASKVVVSFNGTVANILSPLTDNTIKVIAPSGYLTGNVTVTINGLKLIGTPAIVNPTAAGDITQYFLSNYGPAFTRGDSDGGRWGTLAAPWVTNAAAKNKGGGTLGGYATEPWNGVTGFINGETWDNTPITNGIIYQATASPLPAGSYTVSFIDYSEIQTNSSVYCVVAAGGTGIPTLANLSTALASVALSNNSVVGTTSPNITETKSVSFTLSTSQVVSIGFLINMKWGNGSANPGSYYIVKSIKLVKN